MGAQQAGDHGVDPEYYTKPSVPWGCMPIIQVLRRSSQREEFKVILSYVVSTSSPEPQIFYQKGKKKKKKANTDLRDFWSGIVRKTFAFLSLMDKIMDICVYQVPAAGKWEWSFV